MYNFVLPPSNKKRLEFEEQFYRASFNPSSGKIQLENGQNVLYSRYNGETRTMYKLTIQQWNDYDLKYVITASEAIGDSVTNNWKLSNVKYRIFGRRDDNLKLYNELDTNLTFKLSDIIFRENIVEAMNFAELNEFIDSEKQKKSKLVPKYLLDKYNRFAAPFAIYILTFIGVLVSSKRSRSGTGGKLALGIMLCVAYIFAMKMATVAALNVGFDPLVATWVPNIIFLIISLFLYRNVTK